MLGGRSRGINYIISFFKVFFLIVAALYLPQFFMRYIPASKQSIFSRTKLHPEAFKLGLENISESFLKSLTSSGTLVYKVGLITNQTGVDRSGKKNVDILREKGVKITALVYPFSRYTQEYMKEFSIPTFPLYKNDALSINRRPFSLVDVVIFDIQDVGLSHYSFIKTLFDVITIASDMDKTVVVLDRPNLLGSNIEGIHTLAPLRYGITVGELAQYLNQHILEKAARLQVVPMMNYNRTMQNYSLSTPLLCAGMNLNSYYGYSFLGLLKQVGPFNIGTDTDNAFQCLLLPNSLQFSRHKWYELQEKFKHIGIKSKLYSYFNEKDNEHYTGLRLFVQNSNDFSSLNTLLTALTFFNQSGVPLTFSAEFDAAVGTCKIREYVQGKIDRTLVEQELNKDLQTFYHRALDSLLYQPLPKLIQV